MLFGVRPARRAARYGKLVDAGFPEGDQLRGFLGRLADKVAGPAKAEPAAKKPRTEAPGEGA